MLVLIYTMSNLTLAITVLIVLYVIYGIATYNVGHHEQYLFGYWVGDDNFCAEAEIESLSMFIGAPECGWRRRERHAYILLQMNNGDIISQGLTFDYVPGWAGPGIGPYSINASVDFDDVPLWGDAGCVTISVDPRNGTMRIYDGDKLYAKLYKEHSITNTF